MEAILVILGILTLAFVYFKAVRRQPTCPYCGKKVKIFPRELMPKCYECGQRFLREEAE